MSPEDYLSLCTNTLDDIMAVVDSVGVYDYPDGSCFLKDCSRQEAYKAIIQVRNLVHRIDTLMGEMQYAEQSV